MAAGRPNSGLPDTSSMIGNETLICHSPYNTETTSIWHSSNPLQASTPLLLLQLSIISLVSRLIDLCLRPLGQSSIVSQIFGGIVLGPSVLGHKEVVTKTLFPRRGTQTIETIGSFGLMFFFFSIGVKMNPATILRPERKAIIIGFSIFFFTMALPIILSLMLIKFVPMDTSLATGLPMVAASQALTTFPVIACLLTELKLLKTDIGRLALSSAMVCDILGIVAMIIVFTTTENKNNHILTSVWAILSVIALVGAIVFIIRPAILWMLSCIPDGKSVNEMFTLAIFIFVLVVGFLSEIIGQHFTMGPIILGLVVPEGPPLGSAIVSKLEAFIPGLLYPTYLAVSGLKTNVFKVHFQSIWIVGVVVLFASLVKIAATMLPAICSNIPVQDAFVLGLILNARGIVEIMVYNLWLDSQVFSDQEFALAVISVLAVTAAIIPLIKIIYDPSRQYISIKRSTIQHAKHRSGLRILVCVHNNDNIRTIINLLDVSHASEESPVEVVALILVEIVGRTAPILVAHQPQEIPTTGASTSGQIVNAFRQFEHQNEGCATVQLFTSISQFNAMHDDICQVALNKRSNIVIVPFHKQWAIDGSVGSTNRTFQTINLEVLEKAPCSVGILIDRGILSGSLSVLTSRSLYHVAVLYIGGADDAESLAYGARMAKHGSVNLTVIHFLLFRSENSKDRKHDTDLINEYRQGNMGNEQFEYVVEVVRDVEGLSASIKAMVDSFDLIIVGRHHKNSPLLTGFVLDAWCECPELGVIGDMLATPDFGTTASVLVVQQHRIGRTLMNHTTQEDMNDREFFVHDVQHDSTRPTQTPNGSWSVAIDR